MKQSAGVHDPNRNNLYNLGLAVLVLVCVYMSQYQFQVQTKKETVDSSTDLKSKSEKSEAKEDDAAELALKSRFSTFRNNYLFTYAFVMLSDWLQGPYIYALYKSYGYELNEIGVLFVAGFLSSAVFGTIVGSVADRMGRKLGCITFCVTYFISCVTKFFPDFPTLLLGRVLGGVSTSLLFSVFESWMVSEHGSRGFDMSWLSDTFAWCTFLNGLVAIIAGIIANIVVDSFGLVAPFFVSGIFLIVSGFVISVSWNENYGNAGSLTKPAKSMWEVAKLVQSDINIFAAGTIQYCFESAMYTFVFLWSPVLETSAGEGIALPFGVMFSSFMVCIMIGSILFKMLIRKNISHETIASYVFLVAAGSFVVPAVTKNEFLVYAAFNLFELCCGIYFPALGSIRSRVIPEETRSTVMNLFRVPLNLIVVVVLLRVDSVPRPLIFGLCSILMLVSYVYVGRMEKQLSYVRAASDEEMNSPGGH